MAAVNREANRRSFATAHRQGDGADMQYAHRITEGIQPAQKLTARGNLARRSVRVSRLPPIRFAAKSLVGPHKSDTAWPHHVAETTDCRSDHSQLMRCETRDHGRQGTGRSESVQPAPRSRPAKAAVGTWDTECPLFGSGKKTCWRKRQESSRCQGKHRCDFRQTSHRQLSSNQPGRSRLNRGFSLGGMSTSCSS